jgi:hypothetical protein
VTNALAYYSKVLQDWAMDKNKNQIFPPLASFKLSPAASNIKLFTIVTITVSL